MTEPELSDAEQEAVRRLLAAARHDEPMPADVVARLDGVLAELSAETGSPGTDEVVAIGTDEVVAIGSAPSRRPRRWPAYLLSAAAVVAIGFGVSQMIPSAQQSGSGDADSGVAEDARPSSGAGSGSQDSVRPPSEAPNAAESAPGYAAKSVPLPDIKGLEPRPRTQELKDAQRSERSALRLAQRCVPHDVPPDSLVRPASFRGKDAVVLYLPPTPSERRVEVYVCGSDSEQPVRSLSLPLEE